jgi:hypothetical protein
MTSIIPLAQNHAPHNTQDAAISGKVSILPEICKAPPGTPGFLGKYIMEWTIRLFVHTISQRPDGQLLEKRE